MTVKGSLSVKRQKRLTTYHLSAQLDPVVYKLTNCLAADRLKRFQMGLSSMSPEDLAPFIDNYAPCATVEEPLGLSETRAFQCVGRGRYFIVQLLYREFLTLCEVEVYGSRKSAAYDHFRSYFVSQKVYRSSRVCEPSIINGGFLIDSLLQRLRYCSALLSCIQNLKTLVLVNYNQTKQPTHMQL